MNIDLDAQLANLPVWDLSLKHDGVNYAVRELTLDEFNALAQRFTSKILPGDDVTVLQGMFVGDVTPDVTKWSAIARDKAYAAIGAYLNAHLQRERAAIRDLVNRGFGLTK